MVVRNVDMNTPNTPTPSEQQLIDEIKSIMAEIFQMGVFSGTKEILIMTPKEENK